METATTKRVRKYNCDGDNALTSVDSGSNFVSSGDGASGGSIYVDGVRQNATSSVESGSNSVDGSRYKVVTSIDHSRSLNKSRTSRCRNNHLYSDIGMSYAINRLVQWSQTLPEEGENKLETKVSDS